jgi:hypothetical protein
MMHAASTLSLYFSTSLADAMRMRPSTVEKFFKSKAFKDWEKAREAELKTQVAIVARLNEVIRACGVVAKTIAKTR